MSASTWAAPLGSRVRGVDDKLFDHPSFDGLFPGPAGIFLFVPTCVLACGSLFCASFTLFISASLSISRVTHGAYLCSFICNTNLVYVLSACDLTVVTLV